MSLRKVSVPKNAFVGLGLVLALATSCLFSTTAPDRRASTVPVTPENQAEVTGLVQHVDARDNHVRNTPDRVVRARWYRYQPAQHAYVLIRVSTVRSGNGGAYRIVYADPSIAAVEVDALQCEVSPEDTNVEGCLQSINNPRCAIWTRSVFITLAPGEQVQTHLRVPCAVVP